MSNEDRPPLDDGVEGQLVGILAAVFFGLFLWTFLAPVFEAIFR